MEASTQAAVAEIVAEIEATELAAARTTTKAANYEEHGALGCEVAVVAKGLCVGPVRHSPSLKPSKLKLSPPPSRGRNCNPYDRTVTGAATNGAPVPHPVPGTPPGQQATPHPDVPPNTKAQGPA